MDYTDLVFLGEREIQNLRPPRDLERWIISLLSLPSPIPYIVSSIRSFIDLCDHARCSWNLEKDAADYTDLLFFGDRPLALPIPTPDNQTEHKANTALIECQCCFSDHDIASTISCPADHFFCIQCFSTYASTQLGGGNPDLLCLDTSGCHLAFGSSEQARVLPPKLISLRSRLVVKRELRAANLDCFEECPFCDWGCIMEASIQLEPLFLCRNRENGCGVMSCRKCKKKSHLPRPCEEERGKKEARLAIEEAMSKALVRNCPNCTKAFIKTEGCNKMTCPECKTASCYICRQVVQSGYAHFHGNAPGNAGSSSANTRCPLYDLIPLNDQHSKDVQQARERTAALYAYEAKALSPGDP